MAHQAHGRIFSRKQKLGAPAVLKSLEAVEHSRTQNPFREPMTDNRSPTTSHFPSPRLLSLCLSLSWFPSSSLLFTKMTLLPFEKAKNNPSGRTIQRTLLFLLSRTMFTSYRCSNLWDLGIRILLWSFVSLRTVTADLVLSQRILSLAIASAELSSLVQLADPVQKAENLGFQVEEFGELLPLTLSSDQRT